MQQYACLLFDLAHRQGVGLIYRVITRRWPLAASGSRLSRTPPLPGGEGYANNARTFFRLTVEHANSCVGGRSGCGRGAVDDCNRGDKFDSCTMSRSTNDLDVSFIRDQDGLILLVESSKWHLERGKVYPVTLAAGSWSVEAMASAETKGVTIALNDRPLNERIRTANVLEVMGEGKTLRVPLDGTAAALSRLESCFVKNSRQSSDTNPFVAPNRKP
jgi:hypothetical protein